MYQHEMVVNFVLEVIRDVRSGMYIVIDRDFYPMAYLYLILQIT